MSCIFCDIVKGDKQAYKVWESEDHLAFLSIFPNTEGLTVVIPKQHYSSYAFDLPEQALADLVLAAKQVGKLIDSKFDDVGRCAMVFEGFGVDHVHAKLFPMHGTANMTEWKPIEQGRPEYYEKYPGYISTHNYDMANDKALKATQDKIVG